MSSCSGLETRSFLKIILKKGMFMKFVRYIANVKLLLALHLCTESKQVRAKQCPTMICITLLGVYWAEDKTVDNNWYSRRGLSLLFIKKLISFALCWSIRHWMSVCYVLKVECVSSYLTILVKELWYLVTKCMHT